MLKPNEIVEDSKDKLSETVDFQWLIDSFNDVRIMRYQVPGFENLDLKMKKQIYYLSQAALCGRDIVFDQKYKFNLAIRTTLEKLHIAYQGDRTCKDWIALESFLKRIWFSHGIHHNYSSDKFFPECSETYMRSLFSECKEVSFSSNSSKSEVQFIDWICDLIYNPNSAPKRVCKDASQDIIQNSAINFYEGLTKAEVDEYYAKTIPESELRPLAYGLNEKLVKRNGSVVPLTYAVGGLYTEALEQVVLWLEKAAIEAENSQQKGHIEQLISFYKSGDLQQYDDFCVSWVADVDSKVDYVNGFTETYEDPLGTTATWEAIVNFRDEENSLRTTIISENAQWFEDHSPVDQRFKKREVKGVSAKVITIAQLGGECYPSTPIGINLPNSDWIRKEVGSKSVTIDNIMYAYDKASLSNGFKEEFCFDSAEIERAKTYGHLAGNLHTDLHECLGHGSGQLLPDVNPGALENYSATLEEARADLFALYFMMDEQMIELGLFPTLEVARAEYDSYINNGLMRQLIRVELGKDIEQDHMRNRQLIAKWCFENGSPDVIEQVVRAGKTYFVIHDYMKLRTLFGQLLAEVQRIKSVGDYAAGKEMVERYAVKIDPKIHNEVLERYAKLNWPPYGGFVNPNYTLVRDELGNIIDVKICYKESYVDQMMRYSKEFGFLPVRME